MSLDVTNMDILDCSNVTGSVAGSRTNPPASRPTTRPFRPSTAIKVNPSSPIKAVPVSVRPTATSRPTGSVISVGGKPVAAISAKINPAPVTNAPVSTPSSIVPVGAGGGGGGAIGGGGGGSEEQPQEETQSQEENPSQRVASIQESKPFYKQLWFLGLVVGGIGGYFFAKNKNKNLLASTLIGAGAVGAIGFGAEKFMGKKPIDAPKLPEENAKADTNKK